MTHMPPAPTVPRNSYLFKKLESCSIAPTIAVPSRGHTATERSSKSPQAGHGRITYAVWSDCAESWFDGFSGIKATRYRTPILPGIQQGPNFRAKQEGERGRPSRFSEP